MGIPAFAPLRDRSRHTFDGAAMHVDIYQSCMVARRVVIIDEARPLLSSLHGGKATLLAERPLVESASLEDFALLLMKLGDPIESLDMAARPVSIMKENFDANLIACCLQAANASGPCSVGVSDEDNGAAVHVRGRHWRIAVMSLHPRVPMGPVLL